MNQVAHTLWSQYVRPMLRRPDLTQVAGLCWRKNGDQTEVLLITSRERGRWIIPKGWPMKGKSDSATALQEAWEEAGVKKARPAQTAIGRFHYTKKLSTGALAPCRAVVYPIEVLSQESVFPEVRQRQQKWLPPEDAAELVDDDGLRSILRQFEPS